MQLSTKEAVKLMTKLGVELVECKHHVRGFIVYEGRRILPIHCSFGSKELPGHVPQLFRKSLKLTMAEFLVLKSCRIDRTAYLELLKQKGILSA
jgi:hypothetical protein